MKKIFYMVAVMLVLFMIPIVNVEAVPCVPITPGGTDCKTGTGNNTTTNNSNTPSKENYERCKNQCNSSSAADKTSCLNNCELLKPKPQENYNTCLSQCQSSSSAYKDCEKDCGVYKPATPTATAKPTEKPTVEPTKDVNYWGDLPDAKNFVCHNLMSERLAKLLGKVYRTVIMISLVVVVVLGMMDFTKATGSDNADDMKKAWKRFLNRLIIAALLVMLPTLLEFIFTLFGNEDMKNCLSYF